jgi:sec-independent protein translocase protein TatA
MPGGWEWILILIVALLVFGRRLPDVARSVGRSIVEFKRGIKDIETDIDQQSKLDRSKPGKLDHTPDAENDGVASSSKQGAEAAGESSRKAG